MKTSTQAALPKPGAVLEVFQAFLILGLTSFGGPVAHLGYFREVFVVRRQWLSESAYADLVALCQFLPGPASSQVGMAIGLHRAGYLGMAAAWLAFTAPSALLLIAFAYGLDAFGQFDGGWISGLKLAAVAVVAHAVLGMAKSLTPDKERAAIAVLSLAIVSFAHGPFAQVGAIVVGGLAGWLWLKPDTGEQAQNHEPLAAMVRPIVALGALVFFFALLGVLPLIAKTSDNEIIMLIDSFYRTGALVFGGGHVVLALLQTETVTTGLVDGETFLAGYGAAQAVPGPLFTFAAFLGTANSGTPSGLVGAVVALGAIFLPSTLLVVGGLSYWNRLRTHPSARRMLMGVNAAVVGLLGAALYDPVFTQGITGPQSFAIAAAAFVMLTAWRPPAWAVVMATTVTGGLVL